MKRFFSLLCGLLCIIFANAGTQQKVTVLELDDEIDARTWHHARAAGRMAVEGGSSLLLVHLNTYGGALDAADSIRTLLLKMPIPTVAFVDKNAASAGALIALACDSVYMSTGSSMGAATVVDGSGQPLSDKHQSYMRSIMRSTAEHHGMWMPRGAGEPKWRRDPAIAQAMVGPDTVLSFTAAEALEAGYSDGNAESIADVLAKLGFATAQVQNYTPTLTDEILGFLSTASVRAILVMLILGGLYMEMHTPGLGFAAAVTVVAASLYLLPMIISHTLAPWIVIVLILGIVLMALEVFVLPGFGICGILGIVAVIVALTGAITPSVETPAVGTSPILHSLMVIGAGALGSIGLVMWALSVNGPKFLRRHTELLLTQDIKRGYIGVDMSPAKFIGRKSTAMTDLRPAGKIIIDGEIYDAVSTGPFVAAYSHVRVLRYENAQLYVEPVSYDE